MLLILWLSYIYICVYSIDVNKTGKQNIKRVQQVEIKGLENEARIILIGFGFCGLQ